MEESEGRKDGKDKDEDGMEEKGGKKKGLRLNG